MTALILLDKALLVSTIVANTDANEQEARTIIGNVQTEQRKHHSNQECLDDKFTADVCTGTYVEKVNDVLGLCEALRAVKTLVGEDETVLKIIDDALEEHGILE
jgi:hypothetical protein